MTTTKQLNSLATRRLSHNGKPYAMMKSKKETAINQQDTIKVNGITYLMSDMVPREIAAAISNYHPHNFSEKATAGIIKAHGRGKYTRYKVADCVALKRNKYSRQQSKQAA